MEGTLAEHWEERGLPLPVWVWTNLLAHGSDGLITESVARANRPRWMLRRWRIARSYLAYEVLDRCGHDSPLAALQCTVLIPLELEMAAHPEVSRWSPRQWVDTVDQAIRTGHPTFPLSWTD